MAEEIGTLWSGRSKRLGLWSDEVDLNGDGLAVSQQTGACGLAHLEHIDELVQRVGSVHSLASEGGDDVARLDTGSFGNAGRANFANVNAFAVDRCAAGCLRVTLEIPFCIGAEDAERRSPLRAVELDETRKPNLVETDDDVGSGSDHGNALLAGETDHLHGRIIIFGHVLDGER